jgi:type VI protein secretion system component VasK
MTQVAAGGAQQQAGLSQAQGEADRVSGTVRQLAQGFSVEGDARAVGAAVQQLLEQPVARLRPLVARIPAAETNQIAASFCSAVAPVLSRYPFSQSASAEATLDEVNAAFQPSGSALSTLLDGLQDLLVRQGAEYRPRPTAERAPTPEFLEMLNRAVQISEALYAPGAAAPTVQFTVQPLPTETLPEIVVTIDGRNHTVTRADFQRRGFEWDARSAREAQIAARVGDAGPRPLVTYQGTWSTFRLFGQAQWSEVAAGVYRLSWNVNPGGTLTAELSFPQRTPIFSPGVIGRIGGCVSTVLR